MTNNDDNKVINIDDDKIISVEEIMRNRRSGSDQRTLDEFETNKELEDYLSLKEIKEMGIDPTPDLFFIAGEKDSENLRNEIINLCSDERTKNLIRQKTTKIFF